MMSVPLAQPSLEVLHIPPSDWELIVKVRPNLLVEGPQESTEWLIAQLATCSPAPLGDWRQPSETADGAALLVRGIDTLSAEEQRTLMDRLKGADGQPVPRQVISTSATAVFPLIARGLFLEDLYYRLNIVRLEVS